MARPSETSAGIQCLLEDLTGAKGQHTTWRNGDMVTRLGIAPYPFSLFQDYEISKPGDLYFLTALDRLLKHIKDTFNDLG